MKKLLIFISFFVLFSQVKAANFIYPFKEIANPKCRFSPRSSLGNDCKISMPRITNGDYTKYKDDATMRRIYSILWGATYNYGWDVGYGSHLGVDIATSAGTPVVSIGDGEVITAGWLSGRGNTVVIKHKLSDGKYIYSNYAHMSKILTQKGNITVGTVIGEVGSTGNSYGNHLHFQIDITNQSHPYWYTSCSKGVDITDVVNNGMCRDYLLNNTIDPILFLEGNGTFQTVANVQVKQTQTKKIEEKNIKSREQILDEEIDEFLKGHSFNFKTQASGDNLEVGKTYITKLQVYSFGKPFSGILPGKGIEMEYDKKSVKIFPESVILLENGEREIMVTGLKNTQTTINFKLGKKLLFTKNINFYKFGDFNNPTDASIILKSKNLSLGDEKLGGIVFKTKYGSNQINQWYAGTYRIKAINGKAKFCNVSKKKIRTCNPTELASELEFRYDDALYGVMLFNIVALDYAPIKLVVTRDGQKNDISRTKYAVNVGAPIGLDNNYVYYNEAINSLKKGYFRLNNGYLSQDREILIKQVKDLINNYLAYEFLKAGNNNIKKSEIIEKMRKISTNMALYDDYKPINRATLTKIIFDNFGIQTISDNSNKFLDEKGDYTNYIATLRSKYNFKWKDSFGANYFQPTKNITIGESLYLMDFLSSKISI